MTGKLPDSRMSFEPARSAVKVGSFSQPSVVKGTMPLVVFNQVL